MAWFSLLLAGLLEIVWVLGMKYTEGFTKLWPSVITLLAMTLSLLLMSYSLKTLPLSTVYTVWVGIGVAGVALVGMLFLHEPVSALRIISVAFILLGVLGLKFLAD